MMLLKGGTNGWNMPEGGSVIDGRWYSQHVLERMAPDTPAVRAELNTRAMYSAAIQRLKSIVILLINTLIPEGFHRLLLKIQSQTE